MIGKKGESKGEIRRRFRSRSKSEFAAAAAERLNRSLCDWFPGGSVPDSTNWAGYQARPDEPDLSPAYGELASRRGVRWFFPVVTGDRLRFFHVEDDAWLTSSWGLREPDPARAEEIALDAIEGVLVPGLAFDRRGARLGRGKGFYDRALQTYEGIKIGVAFERQLSEDDLPAEPHDVRMDWIVTETEVFNTQRTTR